jgi:hypothetical protein
MEGVAAPKTNKALTIPRDLPADYLEKRRRHHRGLAA